MMMETAAQSRESSHVAKLSCRACGNALADIFVDLGVQPLCESYVSEAGLHDAETFYPLRTYVCSNCLLVQAEDFASPEDIFRDYAYFSSYSTSWLEHAARYCQNAAVKERLGPDSFVVELASNDGYLLRNFVEMGVRVLGIEPAENVAAVARANGVITRSDFFGSRVARDVVREHGRADLVVANNVLAHVPDINDFVRGVAQLLAPSGVASFEFPHLLELIRFRQFDTIYHEHFSYLSLLAVEGRLAAHGLEAVDVERLSTHGGSLRLWVAHEGARQEQPELRRVRDDERRAGLQSVSTYRDFQSEVAFVKRELLKLLIGLHDEGLRVAGYGAPGKGNTLLNYCGIGPELLPYTVDRNPHKQGRYLPGSRIPIHAPDKLEEERPDVILILPWNLKEEIVAQLSHARTEWGARFAVPIPTPGILQLPG